MTLPSPQLALSILYISYPLLEISEASAGGAEQMLLALEREMARAEHRTTVAACDGSKIAGTLLPTGKAVSAADAFEVREREHTKRVLAYLQAHADEFDLIHDESGSFFRHADRCSIPMLATLHLPRSFYQHGWLCHPAPNLSFNCVSHSQAQSFGDLPNMIGVVHNGIAVERFPFCRDKQNYLLWMGRICEEKAPHLAIAAARKAGAPMIIAGQVYPFSYHQQYFEREVRSRIGGGVEFEDSPSFQRKVELLKNARALLLTSTAEETSSLVAMEAMACGTPVIAIRRGAFPEIVAHGETGFVVDDIEAMAGAVGWSREIDPIACRMRVERNFSARQMAGRYEGLYRRILSSHRVPIAA